MMYALVAPILVFGGGAAIDYGRAAQIHTKLNAAADAAALAALTPAMLQQSATVAQAAAVSMFNGLTDGIPGLTAHATAGDGHGHGRRHHAHTQCRGQLLDLGQHHLRSGARHERVARFGLSQASAQAPPNIDFYVLLDNSPSMALPATQAGITQMQNLTDETRLPAAAPSPAIRPARTTATRPAILAPTARRRP